MNLLLLKSNQINGQQAVVTGRQLEHLRLVHQQTDGAKIRVGEINGLMGSAIIESIDDHQKSCIFRMVHCPEAYSKVKM